MFLPYFILCIYVIFPIYHGYSVLVQDYYFLTVYCIRTKNNIAKTTPQNSYNLDNVIFLAKFFIYHPLQVHKQYTFLVVLFHRI